MQIKLIKIFVLNENATEHLHLPLDSCQVTQKWHELYVTYMYNYWTHKPSE